ncbi:hypothetical protein GCM10023116_23300 [Kistimonas scapharcae]|uniref:Uncharacterized protein n=1 Tax=Kistimonas scapharcae TaxID=1036133 RepID=A0ABP8V2J0_9GAMM
MAMSAVNPPFFTDPLYLAYREIKADRKDTVYAYMYDRLVKVTHVEDYSEEQDILSEKLLKLTSRSVEKPITLHNIRKAIYSTDYFKKYFPIVMMEFFRRESIELFPDDIKMLMIKNNIKSAPKNRGEVQSIFVRFEGASKNQSKDACRELFTIGRFYILKLMDLPEHCTYTPCYEEYKMLFSSFHTDTANTGWGGCNEEYLGLLSSIKDFMEQKVRVDRWCEYDYRKDRLTGKKEIDDDPFVIRILANIGRVKNGFIQAAADTLVRKVCSEDRSTGFSRCYLDGVVNQYHADICTLMYRVTREIRTASGEIRVFCRKEMELLWNYLSSDYPYDDGRVAYYFLITTVAQPA